MSVGPTYFPLQPNQKVQRHETSFPFTSFLSNYMYIINCWKFPIMWKEKKKENKTNKDYLLAPVSGIFLCSFPFLSFQYWKSTEHIAVGKDKVMGV